MFDCDHCGECCRHLFGSELYSDLDRGDGTCIYLDEETNLCTIYDKRPDKCNIDRIYELYYKEVMTLEEYYQRNHDSCELFKKEKRGI